MFQLNRIVIGMTKWGPFNAAVHFLSQVNRESRVLPGFLRFVQLLPGVFFARSERATSILFVYLPIREWFAGARFRRYPGTLC